jgi:hypothetical protein
MLRAKGAITLGAGLIFFLAGIVPYVSGEEEPPPPETPSSPIQKLDIDVNPASRARIKFESDTFDFGSIPRGAAVAHTFKFTNSGQDTLEITSVRPTCGCTTAPLSSNRIAPGEMATIKAIFNSKNFNGHVTKFIYVNSTDPINPYLKISFRATINDPLLPITITPFEADFDTLNSSTPGNIKLTLTNGETSSLTINLVDESTAGMLKVEPLNTSLKPNESIDMALQLSPQAQPGQITESITFDITGGQEGRFTIPCKATIAQ